MTDFRGRQALAHLGEQQTVGGEPDALVDHLEAGITGSYGDLLGTVVPAARRLLPGRGVLVQRGRPLEVQVALPP
mgnify:CR=1 FL=1